MIDGKFLETIGVWQAEDGTYFRNRVRATDLEYADDPEAMKKGLLVGYDEELIPHPVVMPLATDPASIAEAQAKARARGADFYHPKLGWLRWGVKREQEHPDNLGHDGRRYPRRRVVLEDPKRATKKGA